MKANYADARMDYSYLCLVKAFSPDEAVKCMKETMEKKDKPMVEIPSNDTSFDTSSSLSSSGNLDAVEDNETVDDGANLASTSHSSSASNSTTDTIQRQPMNSTARANVLNQHNLVQFDENAKVFTVRSLDQQVAHAVHMGDRKREYRCSCSCPSIVEECAHVLAVQVYLGV